VADRWHLLHNLREMLERWFGTVVSKLRQLPISSELQPQVAELRVLLQKSLQAAMRGFAAAISVAQGV